MLVVIEFTTHAAVTSFDSHYEINRSNLSDPGNPKCLPAGGGSFGPTQTNLYAGQRVHYTEFVNPDCPGMAHITVGYVTVNGPSGSSVSTRKVSTSGISRKVGLRYSRIDGFFK